MFPNFLNRPHCPIFTCHTRNCGGVRRWSRLRGLGGVKSSKEGPCPLKLELGLRMRDASTGQLQRLDNTAGQRERQALRASEGKRVAPLPPIYLHEAKPTGPLESAKRSPKRPKMAKSEPNRSQPNPPGRLMKSFRISSGPLLRRDRSQSEPNRSHQAKPTPRRWAANLVKSGKALISMLTHSSGVLAALGKRGRRAQPWPPDLTPRATRWAPCPRARPRPPAWRRLPYEATILASASTAAAATTPSCCEVPPLTPMAPMIFPSSTSGTPPSTATVPGRLIT